MLLLDASVLLYASGSEHPLRKPCRDLLTAIANGEVDAHLTDVVVAEFLHIRASRTTRADAAALTGEMVALVGSVLAPTPTARQSALQIFAGSSRLSSNDCLIAAVALDNQLDLVSADQDFADLVTLRVLSPLQALRANDDR